VSCSPISESAGTQLRPVLRSPDQSKGANTTRTQRIVAIAAALGNPFGKAVTRESLASGDQTEQFLACGTNSVQIAAVRQRPQICFYSQAFLSLSFPLSLPLSLSLSLCDSFLSPLQIKVSSCCLREETHSVPQNKLRSQPFPSESSLIHHSSIILPFQTYA
jgi:hypothetical protein